MGSGAGAPKGRPAGRGCMPNDGVHCALPIDVGSGLGSGPRGTAPANSPAILRDDPRHISRRHASARIPVAVVVP
eukprot:5596681-Pyramimonas_sp.AAC.1